MKKENYISYTDFLDFEVIALPEKKSEVLNLNNVQNAGILIVYFNEKNNPDVEILLKNILEAAKIDFEKDIVSLKITAQEKFSFRQLRDKMPVKDLLFFGVQPSNFGLNYFIKPYQPLNVKDLRILLVNSLEEINADVKKKKALWSCLKEMYLSNQAHKS